ncbi:hypothetical protein CBS101457_002838 [Exobasidium rhododendri]|nr:hypothetical protein CBS101457_002838 [Exobasidium rhododendri]
MNNTPALLHQSNVNWQPNPHEQQVYPQASSAHHQNQHGFDEGQWPGHNGYLMTQYHDYSAASPSLGTQASLHEGRENANEIGGSSSSPRHTYNFALPKNRKWDAFQHFADRVVQLRGRKYSSYNSYYVSMTNVIASLSKADKETISKGDRSEVNKLAWDVARRKQQRVGSWCDQVGPRNAAMLKHLLRVMYGQGQRKYNEKVARSLGEEREVVLQYLTIGDVASACRMVGKHTPKLWNSEDEEEIQRVVRDYYAVHTEEEEDDGSQARNTSLNDQWGASQSTSGGVEHSRHDAVPSSSDRYVSEMYTSPSPHYNFHDFMPEAGSYSAPQYSESSSQGWEDSEATALREFAEKVIFLRGKVYGAPSSHIRKMRSIVKGLTPPERKMISEGRDRDGIADLAKRMAKKPLKAQDWHDDLSVLQASRIRDLMTSMYGEGHTAKKGQILRSLGDEKHLVLAFLDEGDRDGARQIVSNHDRTAHKAKRKTKYKSIPGEHGATEEGNTTGRAPRNIWARLPEEHRKAIHAATQEDDYAKAAALYRESIYGNRSQT